MNDKELEMFKIFLKDYPGATWWDFVLYIQYQRESWRNLIEGIFGL